MQHIIHTPTTARWDPSWRLYVRSISVQRVESWLSNAKRVPIAVRSVDSCRAFRHVAIRAALALTIPSCSDRAWSSTWSLGGHSVSISSFRRLFLWESHLDMIVDTAACVNRSLWPAVPSMCFTSSSSRLRHRPDGCQSHARGMTGLADIRPTDQHCSPTAGFKCC